MAELTFEQVVDMYYAPLYRFALGLTRNESEARDLTQQAFYVWGKKGHQLRDTAKVKSWLVTTLHRDFLQLRQHENRFPHYEVESVIADLPHVAPRMMEQLDGTSVMEALQQVEEVYRTPLMLFYLNHFSYKEIADVLAIPTGTVMSRLSRGKAQLRELIAHDVMTSKKAPLGGRSKDHHG